MPVLTQKLGAKEQLWEWGQERLLTGYEVTVGEEEQVPGDSAKHNLS